MGSFDNQPHQQICVFVHSTHSIDTVVLLIAVEFDAESGNRACQCPFERRSHAFQAIFFPFKLRMEIGDRLRFWRKCAHKYFRALSAMASDICDKLALPPMSYVTFFPSAITSRVALNMASDCFFSPR